MAQAPGTSSAQNSVMVNFASAQPAGTMVHIESEDGKDILTFVPAKAYESVVISSSLLEKGTTYTAYTGGSSTGTNTDGLYSGGTNTPGTQGYRFTISGTVTTAGSATGMGMRGGGAPGGAQAVTRASTREAGRAR